MVACLVVALLGIDAAIADKLGDAHSLERERGAYALGRIYDPERSRERGVVDRALMAGSGAERAAVLRGICDRSFAGGLPVLARKKVREGFEDKDPTVLTASAECLDRLPRAEAVGMLVEKLEDGRGIGSPATMALLAAAGHAADPKLQDAVTAAARWLGVRPGDAPDGLTWTDARVLSVLAVNGVEVEPMLADPKGRQTGPDPAQVARRNRVRAGTGDAAALSALVETANVAADMRLRREAVELLMTLPRGQRLRVYPGLSSRLDDFDGPLRSRLIRMLSRDALEGGAAVEALLGRALADVFPDLRFQAAAGLLDRARAGTLSAEARKAAAARRDSETDPLVRAALDAVGRANEKDEQ